MKADVAQDFLPTPIPQPHVLQPDHVDPTFAIEPEGELGRATPDLFLEARTFDEHCGALEGSNRRAKCAWRANRPVARSWRASRNRAGLISQTASAVRWEKVGPRMPHEIEVVFSPEAIADRIDGLAREIATTGLEHPLVVPILTGSFVFSADLLRALNRHGLDIEVDFLSVASYGKGTHSSGNIDILRDLVLDPEGRDVLIVDDILDTGRTLAFAKDLIAARGARTVKLCVLLEKKVKRAVAIEADWVAFDCPPVFVVGYGMDLAHKYRELPYVGRLVGG